MPTNKDIVTPVAGIENLTYEDANILLNIQKLWTEIVHWMRSFIHSVLENRPDQSAIGTRLFLKLPTDLYNEFRKYFSEEESKQFLDITSRLISANWPLLIAYKNNDKTAIDLSTAQWYQIADELAAFLARVNKYFNENQLKTLLHDYINLKIKEIIAFVHGDYGMETEIYDEIEDKVIQIASYMAMGIIAMRRTS